MTKTFRRKGMTKNTLTRCLEQEVAQDKGRRGSLRTAEEVVGCINRVQVDQVGRKVEVIQIRHETQSMIDRGEGVRVQLQVVQPKLFKSRTEQVVPKGIIALLVTSKDARTGTAMKTGMGAPSVP